MVNMTYGLFTDTFVNTHIAGVSWIAPLLVIIFSLLLITRDFDKWKLLALNVIIGWSIVGLHVSFALWIFAVILFVVEGISLQILGSMIGKVSETMSDFGRPLKRERAISKSQRSYDDKRLLKMYGQDSAFGEYMKSKKPKMSLKQQKQHSLSS